MPGAHSILLVCRLEMKAQSTLYTEAMVGLATKLLFHLQEAFATLWTTTQVDFSSFIVSM